MPYTYIMANKPHGTLYIGATVDLVRRVWEHKNNFVGGFVKKHGVHLLVYFEECENMYSAVEREEKLKRWRRKWKLALIQSKNPAWRDLYEDIA